MSNFTVNGVYSYTSANLYSYLGRVPANSTKLKELFDEFDVTPTGQTSDLKKLKTAMYEEYSAQVQNQIDNQQNAKQNVPWASLCAQIGIQATGDYDKDYTAFNNAIQLLSQSALDGQAMTYFAGLKTQASEVFGLSNKTNNSESAIPFYVYQSQFM